MSTPQLQALVREAEAEASRILTICNACRYCEGFCAVFPAMTRRLEFSQDDVHYLANLCHNCGACLHACQYAPPHEFAVNVPRTMARVRLETYSSYAWPSAFAALYRRNGLVVALALAVGIAGFLLLAVAINGGLVQPANGGNFYSVFPHNLLVALFGTVFLAALLSLGIGVARFWRRSTPGPASTAAVARTTLDVLTLKYLDGGVDGGVAGSSVGCNDADDTPTHWRRVYHQFTLFGFLLCFAATSVATIYHYGLAWPAPYPYLSLPVLLGTVGGIGLLVGPAGLAWLNLRRDPAHGDPAQRPMDLGLVALLFLTSLSGLVLLAWRSTAAMAPLLAVHLGIVMALFLTMPYGKFAHGFYRVAALLKWEIERRQSTKLRLGDD